MTSERQEKCRVIAEWLGWKCVESDYVEGVGYTNSGYVGPTTKPGCVDPLPDFYTDESACALIIEEAQFAVVPGYLYSDGKLVDEIKRWFVGPNPASSSRALDIRPLAWDVVRRTAIAEAGYLEAKRAREV